MLFLFKEIIAVLIILIPFSVYFTSIDKSGLIFIPILINGLADGLAEPVGVYFAKTGKTHQYKVRSCTDEKKYVRSYEGSVCVWLSGHIFTAMEYAHFKTETSFWVCFWIMGPAMAIAEATSPHTMDTPFLMGLGGLIIYACILLF